MSSSVRVEDSDTSVHYSSQSQWFPDPFALASGGSRHGASLAGATVSLQFHGKNTVINWHPSLLTIE